MSIVHGGCIIWTFPPVQTKYLSTKFFYWQVSKQQVRLTHVITLQLTVFNLAKVMLYFTLIEFLFKWHGRHWWSFNKAIKSSGSIYFLTINNIDI
mgnify:CR=1 FL=1